MSGDALPAPRLLEWPPLVGDLRRLYLDEGLSASKIARAYGLKYASEKTAESTVLYHLKRNGIARRDPAAHLRRVTEGMVDEWAARYEKGESLKQIAGTSVDAVTVFNHLHKRGLKLRDKVGAQIKAVKKFEKTPFEGDAAERAYLLGFTRGDMNVKRHGRAIRVRTSSTHPAMIELVTYLFVPHGPIRVYPRWSKLAGYEWCVEGELDASFKFLLDEKLNTPALVSPREILLAYLAGVFDAEGSVWLKSSSEYQPELSFSNTDVQLLEWIDKALARLGFYSRLDKPNRDGVCRVRMWRVGDVLTFLRVLPSRHPEKKAKVRVLTDTSRPRVECRKAWEALIQGISEDREEFVRLADHELNAPPDATK